MRFRVQGKPEQFREYFGQQAKAHMEAADAAVLATTADTVRLGRAQIRGALSNRAANTLTSNKYLNRRDGGLGVVGYIYGRWWRKRALGGDPADILYEYSTGATIRPRGIHAGGSVEALAIPLPGARKFGFLGGGRRNVRLTPAKFEAITGLELFRLPGTDVLVTNGTKKPTYIGNFFVKRKPGTKRQRERPIPIFALKQQVRLPKRLTLDQLKGTALEQLARRYVIEFSKRADF